MQEIEVQRLLLEHEAADQDPQRVLENARDIVFVDDLRRHRLRGDIGDGVDVDHEQHDIGGVEPPDAAEDARRRHEVAPFKRHPAVDDGDAIADDEHEQVSRAAEAEIAQRQQVDDVVWDMVDENRPVGDTERQIQPGVVMECGEVRLNGRFH
ncbi:hypothetical protein ABIF76_004828 [Bradyrhizobium ottawaense]